ncbi:acetyltransferase [Ensifer adhaerens]|uniref:Acetyltransferase n=1 Tax=Ensifer adhaerens TaxID=106592 RepID=A0A0L8BIH4_ENSAD|nr:gamma carbonic anhydrase family protein [Ensifer adhaerens]KOF14365.1 acetyltransferase [Ensifer adhaerens]
MSVHAVGGQFPKFDESSTNWVAPNAIIVGDVSLGREVTVWFGAIIRADVEKITIGQGSNIQDLVVMHADPGFPLNVGDGCTVGHRALLHGCTVEDNCLIGMGAIVLNGAKIGKNSLVAAGALVTEGKEFPENSLVIGSPAKLVRVLTDAEVERNRASARHYVKNGAKFRTTFI